MQLKMVFFTCNHCGSSLKKNRVEKHYSTECHANPSLSCMDCQKDFYGEDYKSHTKCISEDQKYSGKPLHDTSSVGKGEKKQLQWVETVRQIIETKGSTLTSQERNMLENMKDFENIPRKKKKFENFVRNVMRGYTEQRTIDRVWALLEEHKPVAADTKQTVNNKGNEESGKKISEEKAITDGIAGDENDLKPQKTEVNSKKKLKRNAISADDDAVGNEEQVASKKKKKRKMTEDVEMLEVDQATAEEETNVDRVEEKEGGGDATCTSEGNMKLSKKERKEKKKKEKYEAELQSIANGANEKEEILEEEDDSKSKKKKKKNAEEKSDVVEEADSRKKKEKKRKHKESQGEDAEKQDEDKIEDVQATEKDVEEPVNGVTQVPKGKFKWEKTIVSALQAAPENELLIKRLRKKVLAEYQEWQSSTSAHGISTLEEAYGMFDRKLNRIPSVKVLKDRAKLLKISE
ncbi:hypothetical protein J437_LFUL018282 [Ladona fulva]|uniref:Cell growth-regulating nucleolar protein n=1 Tax=Ladona fulva TaxID=123851 RepID=A0A8K0KR61_LADFU|nr:hypothetical protein J437_LFUL018282 [Ladona fulva]